MLGTGKQVGLLDSSSSTCFMFKLIIKGKEVSRGKLKSFITPNFPVLSLSSPISPLQTASCFQGMHIQPVPEEGADYDLRISSLRPSHPGLRVLTMRTKDSGAKRSR